MDHHWLPPPPPSHHGQRRVSHFTLPHVTLRGTHPPPHGYVSEWHAPCAVEKRPPGYECKEGEIPVEKVQRDKELLLGQAAPVPGARARGQMNPACRLSCAPLGAAQLARSWATAMQCRPAEMRALLLCVPACCARAGSSVSSANNGCFCQSWWDKPLGESHGICTPCLLH